VQKSPNPVDIYVGNRVRLRRLMLDLSQTRLANALGVTFQQVQKYEKGVNRISASRLQHISHILQVPIIFFFEGLPTVTKGSKKASDALSPPTSPFFSPRPTGCRSPRRSCGSKRKLFGEPSFTWSRRWPTTINPSRHEDHVADALLLQIRPISFLG
jgi:transcriptional regulator with XRE-family HTH domain